MEVVDAAQWAADRDAQENAAEQQRAQWEAYIGDPLEDPVGYADRLLERASVAGAAAAAGGVAPFAEAYELRVAEAELAQGEEQASALFAEVADDRGLDLTPELAQEGRAEIAAELQRVQVSLALDVLTQSHLRYGLPVDEQTQQAALDAVGARLFAD